MGRNELSDQTVYTVQALDKKKEDMQTVNEINTLIKNNKKIYPD